VIIPWTNLHRYMHQIEFPRDILDDRGGKVALRVSRKDLEELILTQSVYGEGTWNNLKRLKLLVPVEELIGRISSLDRKLDRPPTGIPFVYDDELGDTRSVLVLKRFVLESLDCRCLLCKREWKTTQSRSKTFANHALKCPAYQAELAKLAAKLPRLGDAARRELIMERYLEVTEIGEFHRWDNNFSIKELRNNPNEIESERTRLERQGKQNERRGIRNGVADAIL
jgi:hypothetical protein